MGGRGVKTSGLKRKHARAQRNNSPKKNDNDKFLSKILKGNYLVENGKCVNSVIHARASFAYDKSEIGTDTWSIQFQLHGSTGRVGSGRVG